MGVFGGAKRTRASIASTTALALVIAVPTVLAVLHEGFPVDEVDLDARIVWVTNGEEQLAGRLNRQIEALNAAVPTVTGQADVLQNGDAVVLHDPSLGTVETIDPSYTTLESLTEIPVGSEVALGGTTLAVHDPASGEVWVTDIANGIVLDVLSEEPALELGRGGRIAVSVDGATFASDPEADELHTIAAPGAEPATAAFGPLGEHQLSAVGGTAVALDTDASALVVAGRAPAELPETGLRIQQAGAEHEAALVATGSGLLSIPLAGGDIATFDGEVDAPATSTEEVAAPVRLDGCAHGAWSGSARYAFSCDDGRAGMEDLSLPTLGDRLEFRVNRSVIALNNLTTGDSWLVDSDMALVQNWDEVTPPEQEQTEEGDEKSATQSFEDTLAERTEQNRPPLARDDQFGVRPGSSTVLPVLDNDSDPDGDVLTVSDTTGIPESWGALAAIDGGRALQLTPGPEARGTVTFRYTVSDGRPGGVAEAQVQVTLRPDDLNEPPRSVRSTAVTIEQGQTIEYNVLADWIDPDGDDILLVAAAPSGNDIVSSSPDGLVSFEHRSGQLGITEVPFTVGDGRAEASGVLTIDVKAAGTVDPVGTADFVTTYVGEAVVVEPLLNDLSPSGAPLELRGVEPLTEGIEAVPTLDRGTITLSSEAAGVYYLVYTLGAGASDSVGLIRVDVLENPENELPPVAVKDVAFLRPGQPTTVSVLANDVSPGGRVMAVQSVDTSTIDPGLSVEVLGNQVIRVTASTAVTEQAQFTYTISDGLGSSTAGVTVIPLPPLVKHQPPIAVDDPVTVRSRDIVAVDVLDNDRHPDGSRIELAPDLLDLENVGGIAFVSGDRVRYQAPEAPGVYSVGYRIVDDFGESATAQVRITVVAADAENNREPIPVPLTGRVIAGSTTTIDIPLDRIDPDGDSTVLVGLTSAGTLGRVVSTTSTSITYEAFADSRGTDEFRYRVQDTFGLTAIGTVRIGVIPPPEQLLPPNAVDDRAVVRPGRTATVPVLANDSDPGGRAISLTEIVEVDRGLEAEIDRTQIVVTAPEEEGTYTLRYQIANDARGVDTAFVQVEVRADAEILPPTAIDHVLEPTEVISEEAVVVDVREGATNPGGRLSDLVVSVEGPNADAATVREDGTIAVEAEQFRIAIAYRLTNELDELSAQAFIIVPPAAGDEETFPPPYLDPALPEQIVEMNGSGEWDLEDILIVPSGQPAIITSPATVSATNSSGGELVVDADTLRYAPFTDYRGGASLSFEVTDGESADDPTGRTALITLPITVGDPDFRDAPPTFTPQNVTIEAGEEPVTIDLRDSTGHPNPAIIAEVSYAGPTGAAAGIDARLSGSQFTVSSPRGTQPGTVGTYEVTLRYDDFTVPGTVTVTTVSSTRPLAQPAEDRAVAQRGDSATVNVLANDFNPFAASNEPLTLESASITNAASGARVSLDRSSGEITVDAVSSFIGDVAVVYVVGDATEDPARQVQGSFIVTVEDRPDRPGAPAIVTEGDGSVTISFQPPASNGNPIDSYVITWGGEQRTVPQAGQHTIEGLTNGQDYTFRVGAHNAHGWSEDSAASAAARPFGAPEAPRSASVTATSNGNGNVTVSWSAGASNGRPITNYRVSLSDGTIVELGNVTSHTFQGKTIGVAYSARIEARNARDWSAATPTAGTATPMPGAPTGLANSNPSTSQVTFSWNPPNNNAQNPDGYRFRINGGGWQNTGPDQRSHTQNGNPGQQFTIEVQTRLGGVVSSSVDRSARLDSPPPPTPTLTLTGTGNPPESNGRYFYVTARGFPPGSTIRLQCWNDGRQITRPDGTFVGPYDRTIGANGAWEGELPCYSGFQNYFVRDTITGIQSPTVPDW